MRVDELKEYILDNDYVEQILSELGCGYIRNHGNYITCSNVSGDNRQAVVVYLNENLTTINYTRDIANGKRATDIFDLVSFYRECSFPEALKYVHDLLGLDYYGGREEISESLQIIRMLQDMMIHDEEEDTTPIKPISEKVLSYYLPYGNVMFEDDGISLYTQHQWEIGFDPQSNSITIPIRDELGTLIAIKARRFKYTPDTPMSKRRFPDELMEGESKYWFSAPGPKSQVLYGLYKNSDAIKQQGIVYVGESEKFTMQLYEMGYYGVSIGSSTISKRQVDMLSRLGVKIVICFDKDVDKEKLEDIASKFMDGIPVYAMIDNENILSEKESPSDNAKKWKYLAKSHIYRIK